MQMRSKKPGHEKYIKSKNWEKKKIGKAKRTKVKSTFNSLSTATHIFLSILEILLTLLQETWSMKNAWSP